VFDQHGVHKGKSGLQYTSLRTRLV
jgi:hypothetical protein